jgi:hypothetical protein
MYKKPEEVREFLKKHGLTGSAAAAIVGVNPRTVRSWQAPVGSSSFRPIPEAAWRLLQIATGETTPEKRTGSVLRDPREQLLIDLKALLAQYHQRSGELVREIRVTWSNTGDPVPEPAKMEIECEHD